MRTEWSDLVCGHQKREETEGDLIEVFKIMKGVTSIRVEDV